MLKLISLIALVGFTAGAANYQCESKDGKLRARLNESTKTKAVLILSDPTIGDGNKTIATWEDAKLSVEDDVISAEASVDLRKLKGGELIGGTRLSELKTVTLSISEKDGKLVGTLELEKRNKDLDSVNIKMSCEEK